MSVKREMLRHFLSSIAYHITKVVKEVPPIYPTFSLGKGVREPEMILKHINGVLSYAYSFFEQSDYTQIKEKREGLDTWQNNVEFLYHILEKLDTILQSKADIKVTEEQILQGPFSDTMTHIGQLSMIKRLAGSPVPSENFIVASIKAGQIGMNQPEPIAPDE